MAQDKHKQKMMASLYTQSDNDTMRRNIPESLLDVVRTEGEHLTKEHCGFKYIMAHVGTFSDFKAGRISHIRRQQSSEKMFNFSDLNFFFGKNEAKTRDFFVKFFKKKYIQSTHSTPPQGITKIQWEDFRKNLKKIKGPSNIGGKVTYQQLVNEGKTEEEIQKIFHERRKKFENMKEGSCRHTMNLEFQKMLAQFDIDKYNRGGRALSFSPNLEAYSKKRPRPAQPTTFCQAVARMMTLVRLDFIKNMAEKKNYKLAHEKEQKRRANNKRCAKYNALQSQMGVDKFNKMKARDQAAKEKAAAEKIFRAGMTDRTAKFVEWRTETLAGRRYDMFPKKAYVTPLHKSIFHNPTHTKHLGYTNHLGLANVVKRCLDNTQEYTDIFIKFGPDPGDASSQVYKYAPISGKRPVQLRKTRDEDTARAFRVCGLLMWADSSGFFAYYIQPDQKNGVPMTGNVYYSLPTEWKDYEQWSGFGVMGNPQKSISMETLFKIVNNNITEVSFIAGGKRYQVSHSRYNPKTVDQIFKAFIHIPTPAEAAAAAAEVAKKFRAQKARAKESARQHTEQQAASSHTRETRQRLFRQEQMNRMMPGENHRKIFDEFFGVGTKQEDATTNAKINLAIKLAQGDIDQKTFNTALNTLS